MMSEMLTVVTCKHFTSKNNGKDYYRCMMVNPESQDAAQMLIPVRDGQNPPVCGEQYPIVFKLTLSYDKYGAKFIGAAQIDPDYVS